MPWWASGVNATRPLLRARLPPSNQSANRQAHTSGAFPGGRVVGT